MPKGTPKKKEITEVVTEPKKKYECGCPVVAVNEKRNKKKCIRHGVE